MLVVLHESVSRHLQPRFVEMMVGELLHEILEFGCCSGKTLMQQGAAEQAETAEMMQSSWVNANEAWQESCTLSRYCTQLFNCLALSSSSLGLARKGQ